MQKTLVLTERQAAMLRVVLDTAFGYDSVQEALGEWAEANPTPEQAAIADEDERDEAMCEEQNAAFEPIWNALEA